jgi:hypothetical protein
MTGPNQQVAMVTHNSNLVLIVNDILFALKLSCTVQTLHFEHCLSTLQWCPLTLSALKIDKSRKYFPINGFQTMNVGILIQLA